MNPRQSYETLTAAIRARQWVRIFAKRHSRLPDAQDILLWMEKHCPGGKVNRAYVSRACDNAHAVPFNPNIEV